jgi:murein DD-endopeptidase MepM/ murein hydrolase activator NlpD
MAAGGGPPPVPVQKVGTKVTSGWWDPSVVGIVTQIFGVLEDLVVNGVHIFQPHSGIDIKMPIGTALYTPTHAVVEGVGTDQYGNNFVKLKLDNGLEVLMLHLHDMSVKVGQDLTPGTLLGHSGNSGLSTGPHLHFEVDQGGKPIDPWSVITDPTALGGVPNPFDAL